MAHKITPSRQKFGIAKRLSFALEKRLGKKLIAVFVCGSVATNTALPKSDIELVGVLDTSKGDKDVLRAINEELDRLGVGNINFHQIRKTVFELLGKSQIEGVLGEGFSAKMIKDYWAVPIFGNREYLDKHKDSYSMPNLQKVREQLIRAKET